MSNKELIVYRLLLACKNLYGAFGALGNIFCESSGDAWKMEYVYIKKTGWNQDTYTKAVNDGSYRDYRIDADGSRRLASHHANDNARIAFTNDRVGYGICQWTSELRKERMYDFLKDFCKKKGIPFDISNLEGQIEYLLFELGDLYKNVWKNMCEAKTLREACTYFLQRFEIPFGCFTDSVIDYRYGVADSLYKQMIGARRSFWFEFEKEWYYVSNYNQLMTNCWEQYKDKWYYLDGTGKMVKDRWLTYKDGWYYVNGTGEMLTNAWVEHDEKWYYLNDDGKMATNKWVKWNGDSYYLTEDGGMATDCMLILNGKEFHFDKGGKCIN